MTLPANAHDLRIAQLEASASMAPPRPTQPPAAIRGAKARAQHLIGLVREESADGIGAYLDTLTGDQLYAVVVVLAAMCPDDVPVGSLLGWLETEDRVA